MKKKIRKVFKTLNENRGLVLFSLFILVCVGVDAQNAGKAKEAITSVATEFNSYIPAVQKVIYAIAGVVGLGGAVSIYIKMNNEEQDIKKSIMLLIGSCVFLIAIAQALPAIFGVTATT